MAKQLSYPRISEHDEQSNFIDYVQVQYQSREDYAEALLFAVPNGMVLGGENKFALLAKHRKEGFKNGVSDLLYLQPRGNYAYLAMETKAIDKRNDPKAVSLDQQKFLDAVNASGGTGHICYGCAELAAVFDWYMSLPV